MLLLPTLTIFGTYITFMPNIETDRLYIETGTVFKVKYLGCGYHGAHLHGPKLFYWFIVRANSLAGVSAKASRAPRVTCS